MMISVTFMIASESLYNQEEFARVTVKAKQGNLTEISAWDFFDAIFFKDVVVKAMQEESVKHPYALKPETKVAILKYYIDALKNNDNIGRILQLISHPQHKKMFVGSIKSYIGKANYAIQKYQKYGTETGMNGFFRVNFSLNMKMKNSECVHTAVALKNGYQDGLAYVKFKNPEVIGVPIDNYEELMTDMFYLTERACGEVSEDTLMKIQGVINDVYRTKQDIDQKNSEEVFKEINF